ARTDAQHRLREILPHCAPLPGAAPNAPCPGYGFTAVCKPVPPTIHRRLRAPLTSVCCWVARTDAQHRLREILPHCAPLPGAALNAPCPGYGFTTVCGPVTPTITAVCEPHSPPSAGLVARTDAQHRLREILLHCALCSRGRRLTRLARATGSPPSADR
ncbi:hypothetical protein, partial [Klebsiella oxytoca]|uniref:hypothetical protein n=1 Tax=Klebsiella oxytoca TaxID=571 RepID=UPI0039704869